MSFIVFTWGFWIISLYIYSRPSGARAPVSSVQLNMDSNFGKNMIKRKIGINLDLQTADYCQKQ